MNLQIDKAKESISTAYHWIINHRKEVLSYILVFGLMSCQSAYQIVSKKGGESWEILPTLFYLFLIVYIFQIFKNISWISTLYISLIYLVSLIGTYFLRMTLNLNNEKFEWTHFKHFFDDWQMLIPTVIILIGSFLLNYFSKSSKKASIIALSNQRKKLVYSQYLVLLAMTSSLYRNRFLTNNLISIDKVDNYHFLTSLFWYSLGFYLFFSFLFYFSAKAIVDLASNKTSLSQPVFFSFLLGFIFNYFLQAGITEQGKEYGYYIVSGATIFQILVLSSLFFFTYLLINRFLVATALNIILASLLCYVNATKYSLRNEPLMAADLTWLGDIGFFKDYVAENAVLLSVIALIWLIIILYYLKDRILSGKIVQSLKRRIALMSIPILMLGGITGIFSNSENGMIPEHIPILTSVYNFNLINWLGINASARFKSLSFVWLKQLTLTDMDKPKDYSQKAIANLYKKYKLEAEQINKSRSNNLSDQTVIYLLSESLSNPNHIQGITLSENVLPKIDQIKSETTSGMMKSDGYGGGTANMEFQTLTGLPMYNFDEMISLLYTEIIPDMTYIPSISDAFSPANRIVIHLSDASHYSRKSVYQRLGFKHFIASSGSDERPEGAEILGSYYSDASTYRNILSNIKTNQSQFFSVMTMQNHSPWAHTDLSNVTGTGNGFTAGQNENLTNYARMLTYTDSSTAEFLSELSKIDKPITVVFYGDHLPGFYPSSIFANQPENQYLTDYFIWSNFKTEKQNYPLVNSSDFSAELLAHTNSKVSPYYALLTEVLNKASVDKKKLTKSEKKVANDLKLIQYDLTEGKNYISNYKDFFDLPK